jgi:RNA polymerase sigma-B factor
MGTDADRDDLDELFRRWRGQRDARARERIVERFTPLARKLALRYAGYSEPMDDLVQVAMLGLLGAIDRFDPVRGIRFSTFAVPTILGELKRHFRDHCASIHLPRAEQERAMRVQRAQEELTTSLGRAPTIAQVATRLGVALEHVCEGREAIAARRAMSLDLPVGDLEGDALTLKDTLGAPDLGYDLVDTVATMRAAMDQLTGDERRLISLRYGERLTQREIGEQIGVSQMQVSRLLRTTLARLRRFAESPPAAATA